MRESVYRSRVGWKQALHKTYGTGCMRCGWGQARCDVHHIQPIRHGGKMTLSNGIILCPNCHRMAESGVLSTAQVITFREQAKPLDTPLSDEDVKGVPSPPDYDTVKIKPHGLSRFGRKRGAGGAWAELDSFSYDGILDTAKSAPPPDTSMTRDQRRALALVTYTQMQASHRFYGGRRI